MVGFQEVVLYPGQFVFGRHKAASELRLTERCIRTCLKTLKIMQNVTIKTTNKYSIISIINWESYQEIETQSDQQSDKPVTNKRPASDQQVTTNKNVKNVKNEKETPLPPKGGDNGFDEFYKAYPKKVGRIAAQKAWKKIKAPKTILPTILDAIKKQQQSDQWKKNNGQFIPNPATWLNQGRWEDETQTEKIREQSSKSSTRELTYENIGDVYGQDTT